MIYWSKYGFLVIVLFVLAIIIDNIVTELTGQTGNAVGFYLSAIICWFLGRRLNDSSCCKLLVDPETGEQVVLKNYSTFMFIKMQWWALAFLAFGISITVKKLS